MTRLISAQITDAVQQPRDGLLVLFHAPDGVDDVFSLTDASGIFRVYLEPLVPYRVSVENAAIVNGLHFPAGTVFEVIVPEGEGPVSLEDAAITFLDASRPVLLDRISALETRTTELEARIAALEAP